MIDHKFLKDLSTVSIKPFEATSKQWLTPNKNNPLIFLLEWSHYKKRKAIFSSYYSIISWKVYLGRGKSHLSFPSHIKSKHMRLIFIIHYSLFCTTSFLFELPLHNRKKSNIYTRMYTDHHRNTLSAATILSPLAMLGEKQNSPWIQDFLLCELWLILSCNLIDWRFDFNLFSKPIRSQEIFGRNLQSTARNPDLEIFTFVSLASFDLK